MELKSILLRKYYSEEVEKEFKIIALRLKKLK